MLSASELEEILNLIPVGAKKSDDSFFDAVNATLIPKYKKLGVITIKEFESENELNEEDTQRSPAETKTNTTEIYCNAFGCTQIFKNVAAYQSHFNTFHRFICAQCKRSMPTAHLLDLHISEQHDAYFAARVARGDMVYACLLEECKVMFKCMEERKEHCIKAHKFPANYRYFQQVHKAEAKHKSGKAERTNAEQRKDATVEAMDVQVTPTDNNDKESMKKAKPFTFTFGHSTSKTFNIRANKRVENKTTLDDLQDMKMALDEA